MVAFSVPYIDQPFSFWEKISEKFGPSLKEVYFPLPHYTVGTGRPLQPDKHLSAFLESGVLPVSVLINPVVLPEPVENLAEGVLASVQMLLEHSRLVGATVKDLKLAKYLKKRFPSLELTASTLMDVFTPSHAMILNGIFDCLVPSGRILRNLQALKTLRISFKGKIRLMVNESCIPDCLHRTQHFFEMSDRKINFPRSLCNETLQEFPWLVLTGSWILPQHLYFFDGIYDELKLAGRVSLNKPEEFTRVLESYISQTPLLPHLIGGGPASVPFPMEISGDFYRTTLECDKNCMKCNVCRDYYYRQIKENNYESLQDFH